MRSSLLTLFLIVVIASSSFGQGEFYPKRWGRVYNFELRELPKSALAEVDTLYILAKREKNIPQIVKTLIYRSKFALVLEGDAELVITRNISEEIRTSPAPLRNILESVLAQVYWQYLKENRHKFYGRSKTEVNINKEDFRTWDLGGLFVEIRAHFLNSIKDEELLKKVDISSVDDILVQAENSRLYRPTLYDFLAQDALEFFVTNESHVLEFYSTVVINDSSYFESFENLPAKQNDSVSHEMEGLKIFRSLLAFHAGDTKPDAFVALEINRLRFLVSHGQFENALELEKKALKRLAKKYEDQPASAQANFELASMIAGEGELYKPGGDTLNQFKKRDALVICDRTIARFPDSEGAHKARILRSHILSQHLQVRAEEFIPVNKNSFVRVVYKNVDTISFSVYRVPTDFSPQFYTKNDSSVKAELLRLKLQAEWKVQLRNLTDYQQHSTEVVMPGLSSGRYLILSRANKGEVTEERILAYAVLQVTDLALIESVNRDANRFQVVDRNTGRPLVGADVVLTSNDLYHRNFKERLVTNSEGFVEAPFRANDIGQIQARVTLGKDTAVFGDFYMSAYRRKTPEDDKLSAKAFLFTDRSIYRPGQTVHFKGILIKIKNEKSSIVINERVEVTLEDATGDEVGRLQLKTNQYGSFAGEFNLPASGLTGEYTLTVDEDSDDDFYDDVDYFDQNEIKISVEEYKRQTFEISFTPVTEAYKISDTVKVKGIASAFSGAKLDGAKVHYRVTRETQYPTWYYWNQRRSDSDAEEINSGEGATNNEGEFDVAFEAIPDEDVSPQDRPVFVYKIEVDITDVNGETRSGTTTVKVGYHSLVATIAGAPVVDRKTKEYSFSVSTQNLNGQPIFSNGTIQIYKIEYPLVPNRRRPWEKPDLPLLSAEEFRKLFPNDSYEDDNEREEKRVRKLITRIPFDTGKSKDIHFAVDNAWELGSYIMELTTVDRSGNSIIDLHRFKMVDYGSKAVPDNQLLVLELDKWNYKPGETARIKVGSSSPDITVMIDYEVDHRIYKTWLEHFSNTLREISVPLPISMKEGFAIHCAAVNLNSFVIESRTIPVVVDEQKIEIETMTFNDKLQPGEKQTWSFQINGTDPMKKEAEVLASMYDASLDRFKPHEWSFDPIPRHYYYVRNGMSADKSFGTVQFDLRNRVDQYYHYPRQYFDQLDWFGFSLTDNYSIKQHYRERLLSSGYGISEPSKVNQTINNRTRKGYVSGRVSGADGSGIPGVNVVIKGTATGTVTDEKGSYIIKVAKGNELVFSFIGYNTANVVVDKKNEISVQMMEDVKQLSEVVVTAVGVERKRNLTGAAAIMLSRDSISSELRLERFTGSLQGRVAGVNITGPGGAMKVVIRGASTEGDSKPLYVVDGVLVDFATISNDDVAGMQVLKGDAATAIYGSRGSNGVILISTKSGQKKMDDDLAKISARKNFNETAFFFPQLRTDENGRVQFTFTTPESLTRWKLQLLAHNKDLVSQTKILQAVTQKELMVTPNAPRFLRVGDQIIFSTKITNLTDSVKAGYVSLQLSNAVTGEAVDQLFGNSSRNQPFKVNGKGTTEVSWRLKIPSIADAVQYKVVAKAGSFSDGEQNALPILSNRMLVTETMPMFIRSGETKTFTLEKLKSSQSASLQNHSLTLEVTSNPAWYALQSLPYLMEFPHECAEQTFARYYANTLADNLANSNPKIREVFDKWASSGALISNLEKNAELKSIIIQETPWLRDAQNESEQKKRIGLLFDIQAMKGQLKQAKDKLQDMQLTNGGFSWFKGGTEPSRYITQHIASGFGHLKQLNIPIEKDFQNNIESAVLFLDRELVADYDKLLDRAKLIHKKADNEKDGARLEREILERKNLENNQIYYLYMRSFFPEIKMSARCAIAAEYYRGQSSAYWKDFKLYMKGMIALAQYRNKNIGLANDILKSLRENSIDSNEMGIYWKENVGGYYWDEAPVETQALMIEVFTEIGSSNLSETSKIVDELRIWLLKNKQTSQWKTTKATTEAVYALLLNGTKWLTQGNLVEVTIGKKKFTSGEMQSAPEAGTGYFKTSWKSADINPTMSEIKLAKKDGGIAWAGLYWQYFEDLDKITEAESPLKLSKKVFIVTRTDKGELLKEINGNTPVEGGNLIRVRIELQTDRHMEFLHLKDMRASGLEPVDILSEYKYQEGLSYYQSTKDASTNFFFDSIEKGVYVFEYDLRANNKGSFSNGIATIQCMYAPEFASHSEGIRVTVE